MKRMIQRPKQRERPPGNAVDMEMEMMQARLTALEPPCTDR